MFSKKDVFQEAFQMTKKYIRPVLFLVCIYILFNAAVNLFHQRAGSAHVTQNEVKSIFPNELLAEQVYQDLIKNGYIDEEGRRQDKLQNLTSTFIFELDPQLEPYSSKIYQFLQMYRYRLPFPTAVYYGLSMIIWFISMLMGIGLIKITLDIARDQQPDLSDLFAHKALLFPYILASLLFYLAVAGGCLLLIIPGIIFMIRLQFYPYFIIDADQEPLEALKSSKAITKGQTGPLFLLGLMVLILNFAGALCFLVGLLFTIPMTYIIMARVYDKLKLNEDPFLKAPKTQE